MSFSPSVSYATPASVNKNLSKAKKIPQAETADPAQADNTDAANNSGAYAIPDCFRWQIWRLPEVERLTGHKKSHLYNLMAAGDFPLPIPTGNRTKGWLAHEVVAWVEKRTAMRAA